MPDDASLDNTIGEADVVRRAFDSLPSFIVAFEGAEHRYVAANAATRAAFPAVRLGVPASELFPEFEGQESDRHSRPRSPHGRDSVGASVAFPIRLRRIGNHAGNIR